MKEDIRLVTREQYIEMLIDASFQDTSEMEEGFMFWCEQHVPVWRQQGYNEMWIRQRIEMAQTTHNTHRMFQERGMTMLEIREELRKSYVDSPELYDLAVERENLSPGPLQYRGNTSDLRQRYTLRVLLYETDKLASEKFCRWSGLSLQSLDKPFLEQPDSVRVVRDLSTVEELEMSLALSQYVLSLLDAPEKLSSDEIAFLMNEYAKQLRAIFISKHGYRPEDSATPYVPVTINGPQDHDVYYAKEYS